jgi:alkanesulfonate monooxygenase SsuD/methylene tetrahydromethanopterin reductase-like flavin-dependent oxidoreductase (luciferase family)
MTVIRQTATETRSENSGVIFGASAAPTGLAGADDELYLQMIGDCLEIYKLGFDAVWFAEHAFTDYMPHPSPLLTMAHIAGLVPDLSLGAAVLVLPWYNPMRLAGEIAMLTALTHGRLLLGIGRGTGRWEYDNYNVDMNEARARLKENYNVLQRALSGQPFTFSGDYYHLDRPVKLRPSPSSRTSVQFYGAVGSASGAEHVAELGLPLLCHSQFADDPLRSIVDRWRTRSTELGHVTRERNIIQVRILLADSDRQAREMARDCYKRGFEIQRDHYFHEPDPWKGIAQYQSFARDFNFSKMTEPDNLSRFIGQQLVGSVETVARRIEDYIDMGFSYFIIQGSVPGMPREIRRESYRRFARFIAPRFAPAFGSRAVVSKDLSA